MTPSHFVVLFLIIIFPEYIQPNLWIVNQQESTMDSDLPESLLSLASHAYCPAAKLESTVVLVDDIRTCSMTVDDLQLVVDGSGASAWDLHYDKESWAYSLRINFNDRERAKAFLARFNRLVSWQTSTSNDYGTPTSR